MRRRRFASLTSLLPLLALLAATLSACLATEAPRPPAPADPVAAQPSEPPPPVTLPRTEQRVLRSESNGVAYRLDVSLPRGHRRVGGNDTDDGETTYPVIFLLDSDYSFALARNIVEHLSDRDHLTPAVVVGIGYDGPTTEAGYRSNRTRDYTPTHVPTGGYGPEHQRLSGGAPAFHRFLERELIPFVEEEYRANDRRVLVGHSYGGLFTVWAALTDPDLFAGYVAVSPSLWYDDHRTLAEADRFLTADTPLPARMYLTVGSREISSRRDMPADLRRLAGALEADPPPGLALRWEVADDETHNSVFPRALSNGLRFVLEGR